jgi:hypothetical protein
MDIEPGGGARDQRHRFRVAESEASVCGAALSYMI